MMDAAAESASGVAEVQCAPVLKSLTRRKLYRQSSRSRGCTAAWGHWSSCMSKTATDWQARSIFILFVAEFFEK